MQTTVKQLSDTKVQVTVVLGVSELADAEQVALTKLSKTVKVPGFRSGKVPASVAAKHVSPQALQEQALDDAISKAVAESFTQESIQAIDRPSVEVKKFVPSEELEFTAEVEVVPKVELGDYKKLSAKKDDIKIVAKDINDVLERMQNGFADKNDVERAAKNGDEVVIDFVGKKDDVAFDGGTATDYTLNLGSGQFIPGFEEGVIGHKAGDSFDLDLEFPKEYHSSDLAGQKVVFSVTVKKVLEAVKPALDDEFAKKAGPFETIKDLKEDVKRELTTQKEKETEDKYKDALISELIEKSNVAAPEVLVADQMRSIEQDFQQNLMYRGLSLDAYIQSQGYKDVDAWREKEVKDAATRRVQAGLVLSEVTKAEKIEVTDLEVDEQIAQFKQQYANNPQMAEQLGTEEARRDIANRVITDKTIDRLVELNK